jgi:hypothetical protein
MAKKLAIRQTAPWQKFMTEDKAAMYRNALPKIIRQNVLEQKLNPREIYNEYRKLGRDAVIEKYAS